MQEWPMRETPQKNLEQEQPGLIGKGQVREQEPWMFAQEDGNLREGYCLPTEALPACSLPQKMGEPVALLMHPLGPQPHCLPNKSSMKRKGRPLAS